MPTSLVHYFKEEPEMKERFAKYAIQENPRMSDFGEFVTALDNAFATSKGQVAKRHFTDDVYKELFESRQVRDTIANNVTQEELEQIYSEEKSGNVEVQKDGTQVVAHIKRDKVGVRSSTRNGKTIRAYTRGYKPFTQSQTRFLKVRKVKGVPKKDIIVQYNQHYKNEQRSSSSLKTKLFRV